MNALSAYRPAILSWIGFNLVWFAAAYGAANRQTWPALVACALYVACLSLTRMVSRSSLPVIAVTAGAGVFAETLLSASTVISHATTWPLPPLAPMWIATLWIAYAFAVETIAPATRTNRIAVALTALLAPLAYLAGRQFGALDVSVPLHVSWMWISVVWLAALAVPAAAHRMLMTRDNVRRP